MAAGTQDQQIPTAVPTSLMEHLNQLHPKQEATGAEIKVTDKQVAEAEAQKIQADKAKAEADAAAQKAAEQIPTPEKNEPSPVAEEKKPTPTAEETPWYEQLDKGNEEAPIQSDAAVFEKKAKAYEELMKDPQMELILKGVEAGRRPFDIIKDAQITDYSNMDALAVVDNYGKLQKFTEEQQSEAVEWFESLPLIMRERELKAMRQELDQNQQGLMEQTAGGYELTTAERERVMSINEKELQKMKSLIVDKEYYGATLTKDDADSFEKFSREIFKHIINPDQTLNYPFILKNWLGSQKLTTIQKANHAIGEAKGKMEVLKEHARPSENSAIASRIPEVKPPPDSREVATHIAGKAFGGRRAV